MGRFFFDFGAVRTARWRGRGRETLRSTQDKQAAARCWRDGQRYQCYTYRFVSSGTLEERMLQRQLSKEGLQNVIEDKDQVRDSASVSERFRTSTLGRRRRRDAVGVAVRESTRRDAVVRHRSTTCWIQDREKTRKGVAVSRSRSTRS